MIWSVKVWPAVPDRRFHNPLHFRRDLDQLLTYTMVSINSMALLLSSCADYSVKGGGARYPYPKEVWTPAGNLGQTPTVHVRTTHTSPSLIGGWWTRPSNWKANTAILFAGILGVSYGVWTISADKEVSSLLP